MPEVEERPAAGGRKAGMSYRDSSRRANDERRGSWE
jgi:hypothetical protein